MAASFPKSAPKICGSSLDDEELSAHPGRIVDSGSVSQVEPSLVDGRAEIVQRLGPAAEPSVPQAREKIRERLFDSWLETRRIRAKVEWNWGSAAATASLLSQIQAAGR
jgi:hypothetical protein